MLQGLLGCSSPGSRACCGCFDLLARAVCATRLVTVDVVSGFSQVSSTQAEVKALILLSDQSNDQINTSDVPFFNMQVDMRTQTDGKERKKYSHSHRVRSASPLVSAFGQILFFL